MQGTGDVNENQPRIGDFFIFLIIRSFSSLFYLPRFFDGLRAQFFMVWPWGRAYFLFFYLSSTIELVKEDRCEFNDGRLSVKEEISPAGARLA